MREFGSWSEQTSSAGRIYYYNSETEWEKPREWREHELRIEAERQEQQRMQPIPPPPYYPNYQYPGGLPPPPGFPGFSGPQPPHYANPFVPPAIPPLPPPPRRDGPRTSEYFNYNPRPHGPHGHAAPSAHTLAQYPPPPPPPLPAPRLLSPPSCTPSRGNAVPAARNYGRPSPSSSQGPSQRYDSRVPVSQSESSRPPQQREEQSAPHPYATPQPLMGQPYRDQTTPRRVQQRESHESEREKTRSVKRELEAGPSEDRAVKRQAKEEEERTEQQYQYQPEENTEQEAQEGNEEWRPYYRHDLSQRKAAELHLEDDSELAELRCLELENKWQKAEIQAKEAAAKKMVLLHEVEMTNMRLESCRQQQREIEMRAAQPVFLTGDRRKEHLQQLLKRLQAMKTTSGNTSS